MGTRPDIISRKDKYTMENKLIKTPVDKTENKMTNNSKLDKKDKKLIIILFIVFAILSFIIGAIIGYGIVGDGNALDILRLETWTHIFKLVFG